MRQLPDREATNAKSELAKTFRSNTKSRACLCGQFLGIPMVLHTPCPEGRGHCYYATGGDHFNKATLYFHA